MSHIYPTEYITLKVKIGKTSSHSTTANARAYWVMKTPPPSNMRQMFIAIQVFPGPIELIFLLHVGSKIFEWDLMTVSGRGNRWNLSSITYKSKIQNFTLDICMKRCSWLSECCILSGSFMLGGHFAETTNVVAHTVCSQVSPNEYFCHQMQAYCRK